MFTRFPVPGRAKTRLIPALGEQGAADLHRRLTEWTVAMLRRAREKLGCDIRLCVTGADGDGFAQWLGDDGVAIEPQVEGDLGARLLHALESSFARGHDRSLLIGADCPELSVAHLDRAFTVLENLPMVIGPATDGGYYLLGLRPPAPVSLFEGIAWGGETVFSQTTRTARSAGLVFHTLDPLRDIDLPADLEHAARLGLVG